MDNPRRLEENMGVLSAEMVALAHLRDHVAGKEGAQMDRWLQNVQGREHEVDAIRRELNELGSGFHLNLKARNTLNRRVIETLKAVKVLKQEGNSISESVRMFLTAFVTDQPKQYSHGDLKIFTSNFSKSKKVGSDGFGDVYIGHFPGGRQVTIKVLADKDIVEEIFMNEVSTMGKASHRNLVKLYGFCYDEHMKALIYEYVEYGSLDKILYENYLDIEWEKLYSIAIQTAKGLAYLHHDCSNQIIHHDVKAANILLDKNYSPKVTDFGLAKIVQRDVSHVTLTRTRGTPGYAAPEMWMPAARITYKCDVYSFGMMLFEILGRRCNSEPGEKWFPKVVWNMFEKGQLYEIMEDSDIEEHDQENAEVLSKVALWCVQLDPERRPSMTTVVNMLEKEKPVTTPPNPFPH
ncbi:hypothetical protein AQUCO_08300045v1 [Aquilegia coerulea]|uniref:Protein kinase domain-containing protein n=1 Tax=Aquilegia coerulea TaxID=218851 RepID=A0A2G5C714_AQUCA|nr:hypothetical protein AQUCO_08300045v1 [Aquilegia coerulea]